MSEQAMLKVNKHIGYDYRPGYLVHTRATHPNQWKVMDELAQLLNSFIIRYPNVKGYLFDIIASDYSTDVLPTLSEEDWNAIYLENDVEVCSWMPFLAGEGFSKEHNQKTLNALNTLYDTLVPNSWFFPMEAYAVADTDGNPFLGTDPLFMGFDEIELVQDSNQKWVLEDSPDKDITKLVRDYADMLEVIKERYLAMLQNVFGLEVSTVFYKNTFIVLPQQS